jgi:hypothetical protein
MNDPWEFYGMVIPECMRDSLEWYVKEGRPVGSFLSAVICNDLREAVAMADDENIRVIPAYVNFFYNHSPATCWGSREIMQSWIQRHAEERKKNEQT